MRGSRASPCQRFACARCRPASPACSAQAVLAVGGHTLVYLELGDGSISEAGRLALDADIACLDVTPVGAAPRGPDPRPAALLCARRPLRSPPRGNRGGAASSGGRPP